ncbi:hypothetical protein [Bacillus cereus]|uniref:hypothetical protein n=1 Tax=Bacillus cereus TaxID=1396 RepID=UPI0013D55570|nr:hypothetical protein [Bacillus cereus]
MEIRLPHNTTYDFGIGVDRLSGAAMNKVVEGKITGVQHAPGSIQSFDVSRVRTSHELQHQLGIDIEASYGCASFGAGIEARFNYMKESKIQSTCLFMTVNATIHYEDLSIDEPSLTVTAGQMMDRPDIFEQRYGDIFIRACKRGGLFIGVLRIETNSEEEASLIEGKLKGTYGVFSAEAKAKVKEVINSYNVNVYCSIYSEGGPSIQMRHPNDPDELLDSANYWMKEMNEKPDQYARVYEWTLSPITIAEGPLPPNLVDLEHGQDILKFCARKRVYLIDQLNQLDFIISHPERFDWTNSASKEEILEAYNKTQVDLDTIADCASAATNHPMGAKFPADYAVAQGSSFPLAIVPSPLPKPKGASPGPLIKVPNMVGENCRGFSEAFSCLKVGTVDQCLAGTLFPNIDGNPTPIWFSRELAEFLVLTLRGELTLTIDPPVSGGVDELCFSGPWECTAQYPPAGTFVPAGSEVIIKFECHAEFC